MQQMWLRTSYAALGRDRVQLRTVLTAERSMWIAVRALGERQAERDMTVAPSAPIYVIIDGQPSWKAEAVPELVEYQRAQLQELLSSPIEPDADLEPWETRALLLEQCPVQRELLVPRVEMADARYEELLQQVRAERRDTR